MQRFKTLFLPLTGIFSLLTLGTTLLRPLSQVIWLQWGVDLNTLQGVRTSTELGLSFATLLTFLFLSTRYSARRLFQWGMVGFAVFVGLFGLLLSRSHGLWFPVAFSTLSSVGTTMAFLLFWGYANTIVTFKECARYYSLIGLGAVLPFFLTNQLLYYTTSIGVISGLALLCAVLSLWWFNSLSKKHDTPQEEPSSKTPRALLPYLGLLALLALAIPLAKGLFDVTFKGNLRLAFTTPEAYSHFMGGLSMAVGAAGIVGTALLLFVAWKFPQKMGKAWKKFAAVLAVLTFGLGSASFILWMTPSLNSYQLGMGATTAVIIWGFARSLWTPLRELTYFLLPVHYRLSAKIIVDWMFASIGRALPSLTFQGAIAVWGSFSTAAPYIALLFCTGALITLYAAIRIGNKVALHEAEPTLKTV